MHIFVEGRSKFGKGGSNRNNETKNSSASGADGGKKVKKIAFETEDFTAQFTSGAWLTLSVFFFTHFFLSSLLF